MNKIFEHYRGNEQFVARVLDWMKQCERRYRCIITPFLTPQEQHIAKTMIGKKLFLYEDGGWLNAERKRLLLAPFEVIEPNLSITCLASVYQTSRRPLTHRDVLGALMGLGITREQIGDLIVQQDHIYAYVRNELSELVIRECTMIASSSVSFHEYDGEIHFEQQLIKHTASISSMRLDAVVAACIHTSRSKAQTLIQGKCVKVNQIPLEDCRYLCNNNCTVSIRGYGRFQIMMTGNTSRKGKIVIEIGTYQ